MKIRSITCFFNPKTNQTQDTLAHLGKLAQEATTRYQTRGFEVQTTRVATTPFPDYLPISDVDGAIGEARKVEEMAAACQFAYVSLGPALIQEPQSYTCVVELLRATQNVFIGAMMADANQGISLSAIHACANIIAQTARLSPDGFTNLRFAAMSNVKPYGPFFPSAYHQGDRPAFSLAIECADIALTTFSKAISLAAARASLLKTLEDYGRVLSAIGESLASEYDVEFKGLDYSLAPFPQAWCSLGSAIERLGPAQIGMAGSLAAAAYIADTLDMGKWQRAGFNGLMLPLLEDSTLAQRGAQGVLTLKDLLLFSAVCGTGLDTIPLPGEISPSQLYAVLLDVAALSMRLGKPLTARLMPLPGKAAGDATTFQFAYFANSRVLDVSATTLDGNMNGDESFFLSPRDAIR